MPLVEVLPLQHDRAHQTATHTHACGQLFVVHQGTVSVQAAEQHWLVPAGCLGWIPAHWPHAARYPLQVAGQVLALDADWAGVHFPMAVKVVRLNPLQAGALRVCQDVAAAPTRRALYCAVLADDFSQSPALGSGVALPQDPRLLAVVQQLLAQPDHPGGIDAWAKHAGMARSTFLRHFRLQTGVRFGQWRQQLRLWRALALLAEGRSMTEVALTVGYQSPSAFIQVFRRAHGMTPAQFARQQ